ncbi:proton myo-inositol cotransporter-like [Pollicipes pollicipes]|uniref:proton myo-inositol cotransporter-like n=1 Tax=Pollicipes pollicipes TaxID=41117 RepID=UPI001884C3CD|nr:proton myo-inositol cotransporter-like [Pollicipes pollicipes]
MALAGGKEVLLVGRLVVGIAVGLSSMAVPMYVSESAPVAIRGRLVTLTASIITLGALVASLVCGALSDVGEGWRWMLGLGAAPAALQLIGFTFMPETPRFLVSRGRNEQARQVLRRLRGDGAHVQHEYETIKADFDAQEALLREKAAAGGATRRALLAGCCLQMFQQVSGVNTVVYYSASIITLAGVRDASTAIWLSSITNLLSFLAKFVGLALVERAGRRPILLWSALGSAMALLLLGAGFQVSASASPADLAAGPVNGSCLPIVSSYNSSAAAGRCADAAALGVDGLTWAPDWCPTDYAWLPITGMFFYITLYSPGLGAMPWTITSEIFPLWARSTCISITTAVNWFFNLLVSLTFLTLTHAITRQGTFYLFCGCTAAGLAVFFMAVPETRGVRLEEMPALFSQPWGLHAPRRAPADRPKLQPYDNEAYDPS